MSLDARAIGRAFAALFVVAALSAGGARADETEASEAKARLEGEWRLDASPEEARRTVDAAIDRAAEGFNFVVRGVVRSRLEEGTPIRETYAIDFDGDRVTVRHDDETHTTRLGRTETVETPSGPMRLTQRLRDDGRLEQRFESAEGTRSYVFTPLRDGRVRVGITTESPRMPRPMHFALDYRRA